MININNHIPTIRFYTDVVYKINRINEPVVKYKTYIFRYVDRVVSESSNIVTKIGLGGLNNSQGSLAPSKFILLSFFFSNIERQLGPQIFRTAYAFG